MLMTNVEALSKNNRSYRSNEKKAKEKARIYRWRFYGVAALLLLLLLALVWNLVKIQVLPDVHRGFQFLQNQGLARTLRIEPIPAFRGVITDRYGEPLAISTPVFSLWANPKELMTVPEELPVLAAALDVDRAQLEKKISHYKNKQFMY